MLDETTAMQVYYPRECLNIASDRTRAVACVQRDLVVGLTSQPTRHDLSLVCLPSSNALYIAARGDLLPFPFEVSTITLDGTGRDMQYLRQVFLRGQRTLL